MTRTLKAVAFAAILIALTPAAAAAAPEATDLTNAFVTAGAPSIERLQVYEIAGIVIIRGRAAQQSQAEELGRVAQSLGYARVANLVQIIEHRDGEIARQAEVELTVNRSLDGCKFRVTSEQGVVRVAGEVVHELQKDVAAQVLRNIDGVRSVEMKLTKF
ncbi:MAG TPA: BON domain-containing protein [Thermoanaerobaculia bacterium]|nr:BON domain-containing protein [Thermoanaerobaculia bacterium]